MNVGRGVPHFVVWLAAALLACSSKSTTEATGGGGGVGTGGGAGAGAGGGSAGGDGAIGGCVNGDGCVVCCKDKHPNQATAFQDARQKCLAQCSDGGDCKDATCVDCLGKCVATECIDDCPMAAVCFTKNCL